MISTSESTIIQLEPSHNSKAHGTKHLAQIDVICITQSEASNRKIRWAKRIKEYTIWVKECSKENREAPYDLCTI